MLYLHQGDITKIKVEAIVNAANSSLQGGGGVDGAIHRAGGPAILDECQQWVARNGKLRSGHAMITGAGDLKVKNVIHTVGPVWQGGVEAEDQLLANCYIHALQLAQDHGLSSVAFPNISTGVYGYPKQEAAEVALNAVENFLHSQRSKTDVHFVCFDDENYSIYKQLGSEFKDLIIV